MNNDRLQNLLNRVNSMDIYPYSPFEYIKLFMNEEVDLDFEEKTYHRTSLSDKTLAGCYFPFYY